MRIVLASLLALVVGAGGMLLYMRGAQPVAVAAARERPPATRQPPISAPVVQAAATPSQAKPALSFAWESVESADYIDYIANLRRVGCPEETIRDIVVTDVCKLYSKRRAETAAATPFWVEGSDPLLAQARQRQSLLDQEEAALIQKLLGVRWHGIEAYVSKSSPGYLSLQKLHDIESLKREMEAARKKLESAAEGRDQTHEERVAMVKLEKEFETRLAALLTPQELEEYRLRNSHNSDVLRRNLLGVTVNEAEFRQMFQQRENLDAFIDANSARYAADDTARKAVGEAIKQYEESLRATLGDQRYADYQRAEDNAYQRLRQFAAAQGVSPDDANRLYEFKRQLDATRRDPAISPDQRAAIRAEAAAAAQRVLGAETFQAYLRRGGDWLAK